MKKNTMIWLVIAVCLILVGGTVFFFAMAANHWNFRLLSSEKMETKTYEITEEFGNISILTDTEDIEFCLSDDGKCKVVCVENEKESHTADVQDGTLTVSKIDSEKWFDHISVFSFEDSKITVYLPKTEYESLFIEEDTGDISIPKEFVFGSMDLNLSTGDVDSQASSRGLLRVKISTGDISLRNLSAGEVDLTGTTGQINIHTVTCEGSMGIALSTGKSELTDVSCNSFSSTGSTGDIILKNVIVKENMSVDRSTALSRRAIQAKSMCRKR